MLPAADILKDVAADVLLMQPLHDRHHGVALGVVEARTPHHVKPFQSALTDHVGLRFLGAMRIVKDQAAAAFTCGRAAD